MNPAGIVVERDHNLGWIRINRPDRLNSFSGTMREELERALEQLEQDPDVRCVIITGVGRAFSTGGDVSFMKQLIEKEDAQTFEHLVRAGAKIVQRIADMSKPVIAAVNGPAAGAGACLAIACDLRVASESATIGFGFLRVGLHPDWGGSYFLPRLLGIARAAEFVLTGEMINAERGERLGIFSRIVPAAELEANVRVLAGQIAAAPQRIVADWKRTLRASLHNELPAVLDMETAAQLRAFRSPDFKEGIESFLEKRAPKFGKKA
ncbi:MAG TPA: enoyl-CoA hydratase [Longimicrobiales bacterium]